MRYSVAVRRLLSALPALASLACGCSASRPAMQPHGSAKTCCRRVIEGSRPSLPNGPLCQCRLDGLTISPDGAMKVEVTLANVSETDLEVFETVMCSSPGLDVRLWARDSDVFYEIDENPSILQNFGSGMTTLGAGERRTLIGRNDALSHGKAIDDRCTWLVRYSSTELGHDQGVVVTELPKGWYVVETEVTLYIRLDDNGDGQRGAVGREIIYIPTRNKLWYEVK